jgi:hypothetical protein
MAISGSKTLLNARVRVSGVVAEKHDPMELKMPVGEKNQMVVRVEGDYRQITIQTLARVPVVSAPSNDLRGRTEMQGFSMRRFVATTIASLIITTAPAWLVSAGHPSLSAAAARLVADLRSRFNSDRGKIRVVLLVSPT